MTSKIMMKVTGAIREGMLCEGSHIITKGTKNVPKVNYWVEGFYLRDCDTVTIRKCVQKKDGHGIMGEFEFNTKTNKLTLKKVEEFLKNGQITHYFRENYSGKNVYSGGSVKAEKPTPTGFVGFDGRPENPRYCHGIDHKQDYEPAFVRNLIKYLRGR